MRGSDLSQQRGKVYWRPGRNRRSAVYSTYVMPKRQFLRYAGSWPVSGRVRLKLRINGQKVRRSEGDPRTSRPSGGFRFRIYYCSVIGGRGRKNGGVTAPAPGYPAGKRFVLRIDPRYLKTHIKTVHWVYRPGRNRKSASYYTYYLKKPDTNRFFRNGELNGKFMVQVTQSRREIRKLDPRFSQPLGGFRYYRIHVKILRRVR